MWTSHNVFLPRIVQEENYVISPASIFKLCFVRSAVEWFSFSYLICINELTNLYPRLSYGNQRKYSDI